MNLRGWAFSWRLARREGRHALRRGGLYVVSIALGVAALVSLHSFRDDVMRSLEEEARTLMGADLRLSGDRPLPEEIRSVVDSLEIEGASSADVVTTASMVLAPSTGRVHLLQIRGVEGGWPFYGDVTTGPRGRWGAHLEAGRAIVDEGVLARLGVGVGDTLRIGEGSVRIVATASDVPGDLGFEAALGPRVWIAADEMASFGLLGFGSLARYRTFVALPPGVDAGEVERSYREVFRAAEVDADSAGEEARRLGWTVRHLSSYLGLVGLAALLLAGVGVASAIRVYVTEKIPSIAVLRCIGARQREVFRAYLLQAAALGLLGAALGVLVGIFLQFALPGALSGLLPVRVESRLSAATALRGLGVGFGLSVLFALDPLLTIRDVTPLRALRHDVEGRVRGVFDPWRLGGIGLVVAGVCWLSIEEAPSRMEGIVFAGGLLGTALLLRLAAAVLALGVRRFFPSSAAYPVRQGVSNLFRPRNQTPLVVTTLGFVAFVMATTFLVQASLLSRFDVGERGRGANLLLFDVQPDQVEGVTALLPADSDVDVTPIVPARLLEVEARSARGDDRRQTPAAWTLRHRYRHTWRDSLTEAETLVGGEWFGAGEVGGRGTADRPARVSVEVDLARDLGASLGDRLVWDVSGREVVSVVTSLRRVDWSRFSTNFFVVFEPGVLEDAPHTSVVLADIAHAGARTEVQRAVVRAFPNVSVLDLARVQETVESILARVKDAVRFLGWFTVAVAGLVLAGALATGRRQRLGESALLRTLGASRRQILGVLVTEYAALGTVAAATGTLLGVGAALWLTGEVFEVPLMVPGAALLGIWAGAVVTTVTIGMGASRGSLSRPPLPILRETVD